MTDGAVGGAGEALPQIGAVGEGWGSELGRRATLQQVGVAVVVCEGWVGQESHSTTGGRLAVVSGAGEPFYNRWQTGGGG